MHLKTFLGLSPHAWGMLAGRQEGGVVARQQGLQQGLPHQSGRSLLLPSSCTRGSCRVSATSIETRNAATRKLLRGL